MKEGLKSYLFLLVIGVALAAAVAYSNRDMGYPITHLLSDGFFVAGVLLGGSGVIGFAGSKGTFDIMGYGMKVTVNAAFSWMIPQDSDLGKKEDFIEYRDRKASTRKDPKPLMLVGATLILLGLVFYAAYYLLPVA